ncbi:MAG TPA: biotin--[acetyl-CoA-carboxylase] ligase [Rhizomicrobium sp.]|nr:biotin--[acetyl-CoA-carboxylase] ligase [Rhizomicrobium sp.]
MSEFGRGGRAFLWLAEVGSTNDWAKQQARENPDLLLGATWMVAERQTAGRGRFGNKWQSARGNLFASLLLKPDRPAAECAQLSFVAALAVGDMIGRFAPGVSIRLKWPNDVLADGRKIAGILLESETGPDGQPAWLVIGIGVNLASFPEKLPAISLAALGVDPPVPFDRAGGGAGALECLDDMFSKWYEVWRTGGFAPIREAWLARAEGLGRRIRVRLANEEIQGVFRDIDDTGALVLGLPGGATRSVAAGEVNF